MGWGREGSKGGGVRKQDWGGSEVRSRSSIAPSLPRPLLPPVSTWPAPAARLSIPVPLLTSPVAAACVNLACTRRSTSSRSLQAEGEYIPSKQGKEMMQAPPMPWQAEGESNRSDTGRFSAAGPLPHLPQLGIGQ